jgi:3'-phosphoadenosine 5'-phosphosulfate (PAPS) 3'-phosphatase
MPFSLNDIHTVGEVLEFAARTEIMPRFGKLTPAQVRRKSSTFDLVTEADEAAEVVITAALKSAFPDGVVIGEESTHRTPALLQTIADAELAFKLWQRGSHAGRHGTPEAGCRALPRRVYGCFCS